MDAEAYGAKPKINFLLDPFIDMQRFQLTIEVLQYWHCGTGSGGERDADAVPVTEPSGLPIIPGKHLKGLLREAARFCVAEKFIDNDPTWETRWFGQRDGTKEQQFGSIHVANATMEDDFAIYARAYFRAKGQVCPETHAIYEIIRQTALENGVAKKHTLRSMLCTIPLVLKAEVEIDSTEVDAAEKLALLCRLVQGVGHSRNDGMGRCVVSCEKIEDATTPQSKHKSLESCSCLVEITLKDDVIVSANAASAGGHRSLDYIPGSVLLGIAAGKKYALLKEKNRAIAVFQSGDVSFGPAYPVPADARTLSLPIPASWHKAKDAAGDEIKDLSLDPEAFGETQPQQMRDGFINGKQLMKISHGYRMKTAIDAASGTAEEAKLFGFSYLPAGSRFVARITANSVEDLREISEVFDDQQIRIGRSRRNEFGRAQARLLEDSTSHSSIATSDSYSIFAETDLALMTPQGTPATSPEEIVSALGLPADWRVDTTRSFIRTRRYAPWNAFRQSFDPERFLMMKGSVLYVTGTSTITPCHQTIGMHQSEGLGRIRWSIPNAPESISENQSPRKPAQINLPSAPAQHPVTLRYQHSRLDADALQLGQQWSQEWQRYRASLGSSQWSRLRSLATQAATPEDLVVALDHPSHGMFHHGRMAQKWQKEKGRNKTLATAILHAINDQAYAPHLRLAACREAARLTAAAASNQKKTEIS